MKVSSEQKSIADEAEVLGRERKLVIADHVSLIVEQKSIAGKGREFGR